MNTSPRSKRRHRWRTRSARQPAKKPAAAASTFTCAMVRFPTSRATGITRSTAAFCAPRAAPGSCSKVACTPARRCWDRSARLGQFREISWDEALDLAVEWLFTDPRRTRRNWRFSPAATSPSLYRLRAQQFGTPNYAAHGGFCSVIWPPPGSTPWAGHLEFGQPDWERTKMFMIFGVAEDHDSNPIKMGGAPQGTWRQVVGVNPVRSGYNAIADEWVGITPARTACSSSRWCTNCSRRGRSISTTSAATNAGYLVQSDPESPDFGLFLCNDDDEPLVLDRRSGAVKTWNEAGVQPELGKTWTDAQAGTQAGFHAGRALPRPRLCPGSRRRTHRRHRRPSGGWPPSWHTAFEEEIVIDQPWTDFRQRHETMIGRPVAFHAMRGISAHSNGLDLPRAAPAADFARLG